MSDVVCRKEIADMLIVAHTGDANQCGVYVIWEFGIFLVLFYLGV